MRNDLSGDWLRAIRPDDEHALPEATSYDEDAYHCDLAQGELGVIELMKKPKIGIIRGRWSCSPGGQGRIHAHGTRN